MTTSVLVVDDNQVNLELYRELLDLGGFHALALTDPDQVLPTLRARHPALVLLDLNLAGASGITVGRQILADQGAEAPPLIAITALRRDGLAGELAQAGFRGLLPKPCGVEDFLFAVEWGINRSAEDDDGDFRIFGG